MKYKYVGAEPALLIEHHIEVAPGDVVDAGDREINSVFFVPVEDEKKKAKEVAN